MPRHVVIGAGRTFVAVAVAWCAALPLLLSAQAAPLTLVSTAWPPFTNEHGQPRFALDLVEAALGRFDMRAKTTIVSAAQFTPSLMTGQFDGSAAAWKDAERERALVFSQPYLENRLVLVGRRGADVSATAMSGLKGKRVAIVDGYSYGDSVDRSGPVFVRSNGEEDSLARLLKGDVDYTLMDELVVEYIVSNYPKESGARLQLGSKPLVTRELYFAVRRAYSLFSAPGTNGGTSPASSGTGFYFGGHIYQDWASVPSRYKSSTEPDPGRSTASIFKFSW